MTTEDKVKERLNGRYIRITRPFILDVQEGRYTPNDLLFFSAMKMIATKIHDTEMAITSIDVLLSLVCFARHARNKKLVLESLNSLVDGGLITIYHDIDRTSVNESIEYSDTLFIEINEKYIDGMKFTQLRHFEFNEIIKSGERNPAKMLLLYCSIIVEVFEQGDLKQTNISNDTLATRCGFDKKTVTKYIKVLEEIRILYRKLVKYTDEDGAVKTKNIFTRYDWSKFVESRYL